MNDSVGRARELCSRYKEAHLPAEMAIVQFAFEYPDPDLIPVEAVATALGVDVSAFDYVYKLLTTERKKQEELLESAKTAGEKKVESQASGPSQTEEAFYSNFGGSGKSKNWRKFQSKTTASPPPASKPKTSFTTNRHRGTEWENAPAHLINFCSVLQVAWPLDEAQVKKRYREIAMENHPDRFPGDSDKETTFKEAAEAYERLTTYLENIK